LAEVLLQDALAELGLEGNRVFSAGTSAHPGSPASWGSQAVLHTSQDLSAHSARQVDEEMIAQASLVMTMTSCQKEELAHRFPNWSTKIHTLSGYAWGEDVDIADPFGGNKDDYLLTRAEIEKAVRRVATKLAEEQNEGV